jgi:N-acetyl-alpha-D-muramate 1-phosphate uridylyltransferase
MIFAAGLGTRLKPLTNSTPKALIPVYNKPMLAWIILRLKQFNISDIIINVHHFADQIIDYLRSNNNFGINIEISFEKELLDTGGGLKKASWFFAGSETVLIHNCDILSTIDLNKMYIRHRLEKADVTLAVRSRKTNRYLLFNSQNKLSGWTAKKEQKTLWVSNPVKDIKELSFCGIHMISSTLINEFCEQKKFPIIQEYLRLALDYNLYGFETDEYAWLDLGKRQNIENLPDNFDDLYFRNIEKYKN